MIDAVTEEEEGAPWWTVCELTVGELMGIGAIDTWGEEVLERGSDDAALPIWTFEWAFDVEVVEEPVPVLAVTGGRMPVVSMFVTSFFRRSRR